MTATPAPTPQPDPPKKDRRWILAALIGFAGGSVMASLIGIGFQLWRERVPTIPYSIEHTRIFDSTATADTLKANVTVLHNDQPFQLSNLSVVKIRFSRSPIDYLTFDVSVFFPVEHEIIGFNYASKDGVHRVNCARRPTPDNPYPNIDFEILPYDRTTDDYVVTLYITSDKDASPLDLANVTVTSTKPVHLVDATVLARQYKTRTFLFEAVINVVAALIACSAVTVIWYIVARWQRKTMGMQFLKAMTDSIKLQMDRDPEYKAKVEKYFEDHKASGKVTSDPPWPTPQQMVENSKAATPPPPPPS